MQKLEHFKHLVISILRLLEMGKYIMKSVQFVSLCQTQPCVFTRMCVKMTKSFKKKSQPVSLVSVKTVANVM